MNNVHVACPKVKYSEMDKYFKLSKSKTKNNKKLGAD
jgi:hypothetical protein